jgi:hypothetical protein
MKTPVWQDTTKEGETAKLKVKFYPSYHTKDDVIGPYVPDKIHKTERDRKSYFASMNIPNLGNVNIECDGKELAYINYSKETKIGMNIRHYGIKCEQAYVRPHIKSFFTKHYVQESDSYTYHIVRIVNKKGKGDFIIRRIYNLELFDQLLSNAIDIDDFTIGSWAFDAVGTPKYQTVFSFDKTYLKIEYLNGSELGKFKIPAFNGRDGFRLETEIDIKLVDGDNTSPPQLVEEENRKKLEDNKKFSFDGSEIFKIKDANVLVTTNQSINDKLKTSLTYKFDDDKGFVNWPQGYEHGLKIAQVLRDWRFITKEEEGKTVVNWSKLVYTRSRIFNVKPEEGETIDPLDNRNFIDVYTLGGDFEKKEVWKKNWTWKFNNQVHTTDFYDLKQVEGTDQHKFLIYGLYATTKPLASGFKQLFVKNRNNASGATEFQLQTTMNSIYIVSPKLFFTVDMDGKLWKYNYEYGQGSPTRISNTAEEDKADFSKMGKITWTGKYALVMAPRRRFVNDSRMLYTFLYNTETGALVTFTNNLKEETYADLG